MKNKLAFSNNPYLLQHAENPVEWYEWGDEAFQKAKEEDKAIFLSIGYSSCHWCHVMAHESFEDETVAALMNDSFINVKVDREERPDIDQIYMDVCQKVNGHGGWPLSIIMTAEKKPFFAGTYIPKENRHNRMGMIELCKQIKTLWKNERSRLLKSANEITAYIQDQELSLKGDHIRDDIFDITVNYFKQNFDSDYGGFGSQPKFPSPHNLVFLLHYSQFKSDQTCLKMVQKTLNQMRLGGIWDHIGFGFHRYSTDREWLLPHFEKMLYDQALLLLAYVELYEQTKEERYKNTAMELISYVTNTLRSKEAAFFSSEDADSEGEEGKFYIWTNSEIRELLNENDADFFIQQFSFEEDGNFRDEQSGQKNNRNIPHLKTFLDKSDEERFLNIRKRLFEAREKRVHPSKDDKILTDWNALMIAALAKSSVVFRDRSLAKLAISAYQFIENHLFKSGHLLKRYREGEAGISAHLNDYAYLIWALLELFQIDFNFYYLEKAKSLCDLVLKEFWDSENGAFYFSAHSSEKMIQRPKEIYDGAMPSGNSIMAMNLLRLSHYLAETKYERYFEQVQMAFAKQLNQHSSGSTAFCSALFFNEPDVKEIVIVPNLKDEENEAKINFIRENKRFNDSLIIKTESLKIPFVQEMECIASKTTIYICENFSCKQPITELLDLQKTFTQSRK